MVADLEARLGVKLSHPRHITLTEAGRVFLERPANPTISTMPKMQRARRTWRHCGSRRSPSAWCFCRAAPKLRMSC
jgi:hypothetical protein